MKSRDIIHLPHAGISIAVDVRGDHLVAVVIAACNSNEPFSRKAANHVLNLKLDADEVVLKSLNIKRNITFFYPYMGDKPRNDILYPITDFVRETLGYKFDKEDNKYYPPDTKTVPYSILHKNRKILPSKRINRSVNHLIIKITDFIDEHFVKPTLKSLDVVIDPASRNITESAKKLKRLQEVL